MKILFTKNETFISKSIRSITDEPASHVVLQLGNFIIHSNFIGVHIEWAPNFKKHSEVVFCLDNSTTDEDKLHKLLNDYQFSMYDFGAMAFLGLSLALRKYLKIPMPKSNLWQSSGMFLCTEWATSYTNLKANSMITPYKLYLELKSSGEWEDGKS